MRYVQCVLMVKSMVLPLLPCRRVPGLEVGLGRSALFVAISNILDFLGLSKAFAFES